MTDALNSGKGRCRAAAAMLIQPTRAALELGAGQDALTGTLQAVHHVNRRGPLDDFIAVGLIAMGTNWSGVGIGSQIDLIGSEEALSRLLATEGMALLKRRRLLQEPDVAPVFFDEGEIGVAYVRDQVSTQKTPGSARRAAARAERRRRMFADAARDAARPAPDPERPQPRAAFNVAKAPGVVLSYGAIRLLVRETTGPYLRRELVVNTYGFSTPSDPMILPTRKPATGAEVASAL